MKIFLLRKKKACCGQPYKTSIRKDDEWINKQVDEWRRRQIESERANRNEPQNKKLGTKEKEQGRNKRKGVNKGQGAKSKE